MPEKEEPKVSYPWLRDDSTKIVLSADTPDDCATLRMDELRDVLENAGSKLVDIDVSGCPQLRVENLIAKNCPRLRSLSLQGCEVTDNTIGGIARGCPKLRSLNLGGCKITGRCIGEISAECKELSSLDLRRCKALTELMLLR